MSLSFQPVLRTSSATTANPRPGLTRAGRFNGRVQGEQVCLVGNVADHAHDPINILRAFIKS